MSLPPRLRATAPAVTNQASGSLPHVAGICVGQGSHGFDWGEESLDLDGVENRGLELMRHRVFSAPSFDGRQPQVHSVDAADVTQEEFCGAMNSGGYFTDLIANGLNNVTPQSDTTLHQIVAHEDVPSSVKGNQKRSKNFTDDEDLMLVSAWLNVSLDPIQGVNQSRTSYWKRIHEYFHEHNKNFVSDRSPGSLMNRWSGIQHDVSLFTSCLARIESRNQSGVSINDKQADTLKMFKVVDKQHRNFPYMHCWKILKDQAKWKLKCQQDTQKTGSKKQKT